MVYEWRQRRERFQVFDHGQIEDLSSSFISPPLLTLNSAFMFVPAILLGSRHIVVPAIFNTTLVVIVYKFHILDWSLTSH
jgi:hypothetical protein